MFLGLSPKMVTPPPHPIHTHTLQYIKDPTKNCLFFVGLKTAILNMSNSQKWSYQCINQIKSIENIFFHNEWSFEEGSLARERRTKRPQVHLGLIRSLNSCPKLTQTIKNHFSEQPCSKSRTKRTWVRLGLIGPTNFCLLSITIKSFEQAVI